MKDLGFRVFVLAEPVVYAEVLADHLVARVVARVLVGAAQL